MCIRAAAREPVCVLLRFSSILNASRNHLVCVVTFRYKHYNLAVHVFADDVLQHTARCCTPPEHVQVTSSALATLAYGGGWTCLAHSVG